MTKEAWFQSVSNYDFTAYMELKSLFEYVHARHVLSESSEQQLLRTDRYDCSIYALDKARELVLHTKPESSTVKKLISAEWNYAYKLSRIRARFYYSRFDLAWHCVHSIRPPNVRNVLRIS